MLMLADIPAVLIPLAGIVMIALLGVAKIIQSGVNRSDRERTKRDIAAYVAEGTITPEQGELIIAAGEKPAENS